MNGMKMIILLACLLLSGTDSYSQESDGSTKSAKRPVTVISATETLMEAMPGSNSCRMSVSIQRRYFCYMMAVETWLGVPEEDDLSANNSREGKTSLTTGTSPKGKACCLILRMADGTVLTIREPHYSQSGCYSDRQEGQPGDGIHLNSVYLLSDFEQEQLRTQQVTSVTFVAPDGHRYQQPLPQDKQALFIRLMKDLG